MGRPRRTDLEERWFNGRRYVRYPVEEANNLSRARYFQCNAWDPEARKYRYRLLHRDVWQYYNGPIPSGHHIHHADGDWDNNDVDNLECLPVAEHRRVHAGSLPHETSFSNPEHGKKARQALRRRIQESKHYTCQRCGTGFTARSFKAKYCPECRVARQRERDRRRTRL